MIVGRQGQSFSPGITGGANVFDLFEFAPLSKAVSENSAGDLDTLAAHSAEV